MRGHRAHNTSIAPLDIPSAFNTVDRSGILEAVRTHFSTSVPWADLRCWNDSILFTGTETIISAGGVQQSDPLGLAFFALAIHPSSRPSVTQNEPTLGS